MRSEPSSEQTSKQEGREPKLSPYELHPLHLLAYQSRSETQSVNSDLERREDMETKLRFVRRSRPASKQLVYAVVLGADGEDGLVFIPHNRARLLAGTWGALVRAKTWKQLKQLAPPSAYRQIREFNYGRPRAELLPSAEFDYYDMTPVPDGDYPPWAAQEMLSWMPRDVQLEFGTAVESVHNGRA